MALILAAAYGNPDIMQFLLDKGAHIEEMGFNLETPFLSACTTSKNVDNVKFLRVLFLKIT